MRYLAVCVVLGLVIGLLAAAVAALLDLSSTWIVVLAVAAGFLAGGLAGSRRWSARR